LNFDLGSGGDDFGKMFDHLGKRESALLRDPSPQRPKQVRRTRVVARCKGEMVINGLTGVVIVLLVSANASPAGVSGN
jgi:hypothetical protein